MQNQNYQQNTQQNPNFDSNYQQNVQGNPDVQAQPYYYRGNEEDGRRDAESNGYVNGVYMSDFVNVEKDGSITHDRGPTFKELKMQAEQGDGKRRIVAKKMYKNSIEEVKLDDGTVMDIDTAVEFAKEFGFQDVNVGRARSGRQILRANPTDDPSKALRNLPTYH